MAEKHQLVRQFRAWNVEPDPDRYGAFVVPEIERVQRHATCAEEVEELENRAAALMEAAPDLHHACTKALEWFRRASLGTLGQMEEALGRDAPLEELSQALNEIRVESRPAGHVCAQCGRTFSAEEPLQPINDFWQRVEAGDIVPSGECPECGGLCYLE